MTRPPDGWSASLRCDSRTGAAHLRRGAPCQDASGFLTVTDAAGDPVRLLVVSDGHGGSRYSRSDVGSRLACRVALELIGRSLAASRTGQPGQEEHWRRWLAETLPQQLVEAWLQAVRRHWQATPAEEGDAFSAVPYGATLGVLVLTPRWWGHTGLGDWDLVRLEASGEGHLVSEEPAAEAAGEATCSLCMRGAAQQFAPRSALFRLRAGEPPFTLLLGTDGIRKSCGSDADFLTLARYLADLPDPSGRGTPPELSAALDHISSQGSGDDVSVAIGRWGALSDSDRHPGRRRSSQPTLVQPPPPPSRSDPPGAAVVADPSPSTPLAPARRASDRSRPSAARAAAARPLRSWLGWALVGMGGLALLAWMQAWGPFAARGDGPVTLTAAQRTQLQRQIALLCASADPAERQAQAAATGAGTLGQDDGPAAAPGQSGIRDPQPLEALEAGRIARSSGAARTAPEPASDLALRIRGTLNNRGSTFRRLLGADQQQRQALLQASPTDPLGALIAWSRQEPSLAPGLPPLAPADSAAGRPLVPPSLPLCPELSRELQRQWRQRRLPAGEPSGALGPAAVSAPAAPRPALAPRGASQQDASAASPERSER